MFSYIFIHTLYIFLAPLYLVRYQQKGDHQNTAKVCLMEPNPCIADLGLSIKPSLLKMKDETGQIVTTQIHLDSHRDWMGR